MEPIKREFDKMNPTWEPGQDFNIFFLRCQEQYFNQKLQARGHVFLNEVFDALGFDRTREGQLVGWVLMPENKNYVGFGLEKALDFDGSITLEFNVDGEIIDLI